MRENEEGGPEIIDVEFTPTPEKSGEVEQVPEDAVEAMVEDQLGDDIESSPEMSKEDQETVEAAQEKVDDMTPEQAEAEAKLYAEELESQRKEFLTDVERVKMTKKDLEDLSKELEGIMEGIDTTDSSTVMAGLNEKISAHYGNPDNDTVRSALGRSPTVASGMIMRDLWSAWKAKGDERDEHLNKAYVAARRALPPIALAEAEWRLAKMAKEKWDGNDDGVAEQKKELRDLAMDALPIARILGTEDEKKRALAEVRVIGTAAADVLTLYVLSGAVTGAGVAAAGAEVASLRAFTSGFNEGVKGLQAKAEADPNSVNALDLVRLSVKEGAKASGKAPKELVVMAGKHFEEQSQDESMDPARRAQMEGIAQLMQKHPELVLDQIENLDAAAQEQGL